MKVVVFAPYGALHKEGGLLFLVANYLAKNGVEVAQLRCDGAVPTCRRIHGLSAAATPFCCGECSSEQAALAGWSGASIRNLSSEILPADVRTAAQWIQSVESGSLGRVEFRGVRLWNACKLELSARWGEVDPLTLTAVQQSDVRNLFVSYVRTAVASERFIARFQPSLALVTSVHDALSHAFVLQSKHAGVETVVGWYNSDEETIGMESLATRQSYSTALILEGLASMRNDPRTWGAEITAVVHEALTFLGCAPDRVE